MSDSAGLFGFIRRGTPEPDQTAQVPENEAQSVQPTHDDPPAPAPAGTNTSVSDPPTDAPDRTSPRLPRPDSTPRHAPRTGEPRTGHLRRYNPRAATPPGTLFRAHRPKPHTTRRPILIKTFHLDHPTAINWCNRYFQPISAASLFLAHYSRRLITAKPYWQPLSDPAARVEKSNQLDQLLYTGGALPLIDRLIRIAETTIGNEIKLVDEAVARYRDALATDDIRLAPPDPDSAYPFEAGVFSPFDTRLIELFGKINNLLILLQASWIEGKLPSSTQHHHLEEVTARAPLDRIGRTLNEIHAYLHDRWPYIVRNRHGWTQHKLKPEYRSPPENLRHPKPTVDSTAESLAAAPDAPGADREPAGSAAQ